MARPVRRSKKVVDYSQFGDADDDDEDFASIAVPSSKKLKTVHSELKKEKKKVPKEEILLKKRSPNKRVTLDDKLYQRRLEVALALSVNEPSLSHHKVQDCQEQAVDGRTSDCDTTVRNLRQRAATSKQKSQTEVNNGDSGADSYEPEAVSTEESECGSSFSEDDHDEFVVKKKIKQNRKEGGKPSVETRKRATKPSKQKTNCVVKTWPALQKAPSSSEPIGHPLKTSSPSAAKNPTWTPPAPSGSRANQLERVPVTSPTQGLRLGLSRLARVKPLHPSLAST